jgi:restriction system protein
MWVIPDNFPTVNQIYLCILELIEESSGEISNREFETFVIKRLALPQNLVDLIHAGNRTELNYRLAWARTKASRKGLLKKSNPGVWAVTKA